MSNNSPLNFFTIASSLWGGFPGAMTPLFKWNKKIIESLGHNYFLICNKDCPNKIALELGSSIEYIEDLLDVAKQDLDELESVFNCGGPNGRQFELECYKRFLYIKHLSDDKKIFSPIIHLDFDAIISSKYITHTQEYWSQNTEENIFSSFFYFCTPFVEFSKTSLDLFCSYFCKKHFQLGRRGSDMSCLQHFVNTNSSTFVDKKNTNNYFKPDYLVKGEGQLSIMPWLSRKTGIDVSKTDHRTILKQKLVTDFIQNQIQLNPTEGQIFFDESDCPLLHFQGHTKALLPLLKFS
jgi:hypothetical protein